MTDPVITKLCQEISRLRATIKAQDRQLAQYKREIASLEANGRAMFDAFSKQARERSRAWLRNGGTA